MTVGALPIIWQYNKKSNAIALATSTE